jgi:hypothetical protein
MKTFVLTVLGWISGIEALILPANEQDPEATFVVDNGRQVTDNGNPVVTP